MRRLLAGVAEWMPRQRWYTAQDRPPRLTLLADAALPGPGPSSEHDVRILLVRDDAGAHPIRYAVPIRRVADAAAVDPIQRRDDGTAVVDAARDPVFLTAIASLMRRGASVGVLHGAGGESLGEVLSVTDIAAEQSNTSSIATTTTGPIVCKLLRQVADGPHPDVEIPRALDAAGTTLVPAPRGYVSIDWREGALDPRGVLVIAQDFVADATDGWRVALDLAARGADPTATAHELGAVTAELHRELGDAFGRTATSDADLIERADEWRARMRETVAAVPALTSLGPAIAALHRRAATPGILQRIHGDLHLGQALRAADGTWRIIDFEGEPLRPLAERARFDDPARDVAGMLRSWDYAAAVAEREGHRVPAGWAATARTAFLDGYATRAAPPAAVLRDAFEVDKALYEVLYEARTRPGWVDIPVAALHRLLDTTPLP